MDVFRLYCCNFYYPRGCTRCRYFKIGGRMSNHLGEKIKGNIEAEEELLRAQGPQEATEASTEERPENLNKETWVTLLLFAALIVGLSICGPIWMFN